MPTEPERIEAFRKLLDAPHKEQVYQEALEQTPRLIPQEFVQNHGIHFSIVLRKLRLAENYITDFFYLSKSSADWHVVFVELERPSTPFFKPGADDLHPEFLNGLNQIDRWRAWVATPGNMEHLFQETIEPLWRPASMQRNPKYVKYVLVTGRRAEYVGDYRKTGLIAAKERDDFKILSYDSLLDGAPKNEAVYVGVRTNSHIQLLTHDFVEESTFAWIEPGRLEISPILRDNILAAQSTWRHYDPHFDQPILIRALSQIKVTSASAHPVG